MSRRRPEDSKSPELLNRHSVVPLYYQLEAVLQTRLMRGAWGPGDLLPSERELCDEFGVSRAVVRPALAILEREGWIARKQGSGTRVAPPKRTVAIKGLLSLLTGAPDPETEVHILDAVRRQSDGATPSTIEHDCLHLDATIYVGGEPLYFIRSAISAAHAGTLLTVAQPGARLRAGGVIVETVPTRTEAVIENGSCTDFEASQLRIGAGEPVFVVHCNELAPARRQLGTDSPVEVGCNVYKASAIRVSLPSAQAPPRQRAGTLRRFSAAPERRQTVDALIG